MNKKNIAYILLFIANALYFKGIYSFDPTGYNFLYGPEKYSVSMGLFITYSMSLMIYIFYFSTTINNKLYTYGYLIIIRNKNIVTWYVKYFLGLLKQIFLLFLIQNIIFIIVNIGNYRFDYFWINSIFYILTIVCIISIQILLELYIPEDRVLIILIVTTMISIYLSMIIYNNQIFERLLYILIPSFAYGNFNNLVDYTTFGLNPEIVFIELLLIIGISNLLIARKLKERDII